jgi:acetyl/propionyl-CoA carboxylase alpha subunit
MFKKILIANRGEIAVRVIRACHEMGIAAVAVYSDVDRAALHVRKADEAYPIGAAAATESYLNIPKILDVAARSGADAIHPGYGFLSENAKFARACVDAGVKFIGPTAAAMDAMGSKTRARQAMERAGIPFVPGTSRGLDSFEQAESVAARIGYPIMLKAAECAWFTPRPNSSRRSKARAARRNDLSATAKSTLKKRLLIRVTSRCRYWPTSMAIPSIWESANARCNAVTRR